MMDSAYLWTNGNEINENRLSMSPSGLWILQDQSLSVFTGKLITDNFLKVNDVAHRTNETSQV